MLLFQHQQLASELDAHCTQMSSLYHTAAGVLGNASNQLQQTTGKVGTQFQLTTDRMLPPQQREEMLQKFRVFANQNPKLAVRILCGLQDGY